MSALDACAEYTLDCGHKVGFRTHEAGGKAAYCPTCQVVRPGRCTAILYGSLAYLGARRERPAVITHGGVERVGKLCRCIKCGTEEVCRLFFDFYTHPTDPTGPLHCERCVMVLPERRVA